MNRITQRENGYAYCVECRMPCTHGLYKYRACGCAVDVFEALAKYEDTNLSPEEINAIIANVKDLTADAKTAQEEREQRHDH